MLTVVTGDDLAIPIQLTKDGGIFPISGTDVIKVALVGNTMLSSQAFTVDKTAAGTVLSQSTIVLKFTAAETAAWLVGEWNFEIQMETAAGAEKTTWLEPVKVVKGLIS